MSRAHILHIMFRNIQWPMYKHNFYLVKCNMISYSFYQHKPSKNSSLSQNDIGWSYGMEFCCGNSPFHIMYGCRWAHSSHQLEEVFKRLLSIQGREILAFDLLK